MVPLPCYSGCFLKNVSVSLLFDPNRKERLNNSLKHEGKEKEVSGGERRDYLVYSWGIVKRSMVDVMKSSALSMITVMLYVLSFC